MDFFKNFDGYDLKARIYPALLTMLPAVATLLAWFPSLLTSNAGAAVLTVINTSGLLFLVAELSRSQGRRAQHALVKTWKVMPTTQFMRHSDQTLPAEVKARYHQHLATKLGVALPTAVEETNDPDAADGRYNAAILWLIAQSRGPAHFLILNENTSYGFRRNLLGLKMVGVTICLTTIAAPAIEIWDRHSVGGLNWHLLVEATRTLQPVQIGAIGLCIIALSGWLFVVREKWVKEAAELYALRLLAACDTPAA